MDVQNTFYLLPGALFVKREPYMVTTVLGSCVALCLYDKILMYGGINHFMLPYWSGSGLASPKYGDIAIKKLLSEMINIGSNKSNLVAKLFGGASVLDNFESSLQVGKRNIEVAKEMLESMHIPLVSQNLGGNLGRKIIYSTVNGAVYHKFLGSEKSK